MPLAIAEKIPPFLRGRLGLGLFLVCGVVVTVIAASALHRAERLAIVREFERRQTLRHDFLKQCFGEYEHSLYALRLVAENNYHFTAVEFERAAREIQARSPGVIAVQWAPIVRAPDLADFTRRMREELYPGFVVRELAPGSEELRPVGTGDAAVRSEHAVISYTYPLEGNESVLGYDIFTAPTAPDLRAARRGRELALTRPFKLAQGFDGVVLTCFVRREDSPAGPPVAGPGYMQLVLGLSSILDRVWTTNAGGIADFALYDVTDSTYFPLYARFAGRTKEPGETVAFADFATADTIHRDFQIGGRTLRACYRPLPSRFFRRQSAAACVVLFCGLAFTGLGCAYLRLVLRRSEAIRQEVALRTAELNESRALLDTLITHSPSAIWIKDSRLRLQLVNPEFCRAHNREASALIGQSDAALYPPDLLDQIERTDRDILENGAIRHFETSFPLGEQTHTYLVAKFPLRNAAGRIHAIAGIATDITELRRAEADRSAMERRLLATQKLESLGVLAGGVAHDFNNLLTGILGHANLCRALLPATSPRQESLAQIENAARRAAELCQQMLAYSGRGRFSVETGELGQLVRDTVPLLRLSLSKQARLRYELAEGLPAVRADLTQLRQIIMNLVMNASDALGETEGDIVVRTRLVEADEKVFARCVHSPALPSGPYVCLEVSDTGCGMTPETMARIFDPFFTTKFTGRGLGLAAVLGIVRGHQGALEVESQPGLGTTFRLFLPFVSGSAAPSPTPPSAAPAPAQPAKSPRRETLLLVDDEASVRETAALLLRNLGYEVDTAGGGEEALARFDAAPTRYHAALVDLTMPGMSGGDLLRALQARRTGFPILIMSGYSETDVAGHLAAPRTAFLPKPFTLALLQEKLEALLNA